MCPGSVLNYCLVSMLLCILHDAVHVGHRRMSTWNEELSLEFRTINLMAFEVICDRRVKLSVAMWVLDR